MYFLPFLSSSAVKFQVEASLVLRSPFAVPAPFSFLSATPFPIFTVFFGTLREFPSRSLSLFSPQVLLQIAFHNNVVLFRGANLSVPSVMPGSVFIPYTNCWLSFHSEAFSGLLSTLREWSTIRRGQKVKRRFKHRLQDLCTEWEHKNTRMVV